MQQTKTAVLSLSLGVQWVSSLASQQIISWSAPLIWMSLCSSLTILEQNTTTCNFAKLSLQAPYLLRYPNWNQSPSTPTTSAAATLAQTHIFLTGLLPSIPYQSSCLQSHPRLLPVFSLLPERKLLPTCKSSHSSPVPPSLPSHPTIFNRLHSVFPTE